jgi:uncharacterized MnhB-related membrane protein
VNEWTQIAIVALLPLSALATVLQTRPFYALVCRGIMGAAAALIYAMLGAPDVALTEALMGTLLTILLYSIAVRSSMIMRIGWMEEADYPIHHRGPACDIRFAHLMDFCRRHNLLAEFHLFTDSSSLLEALSKGRIDAVHGPAGFFQSKLPALSRVPPAHTEEQVLFLAEHARSLERLLSQFSAKRPIQVYRILKSETEQIQ